MGAKTRLKIVRRSLKYNFRILLNILALIIFLLTLLETIEAGSLRRKNAEKELELVNKSLEDLELYLRGEDKNKICLEAKKASKLIKESIHGLKKIEPNYNWIEIREVLIRIPIKNCPGKFKSNTTQF
ncbi:hypothetical protein [Prochlorococcus sp. MIT 1307]|uniref:hypothetical protein n=1 Tax=Prochlorococcus sp. MIT 1307 TaxID=3096219 RepID=UPI002A761CAF|nr:hypothetical protein [Prochlorococcus sp. MIT 1307]